MCKKIDLILIAVFLILCLNVNAQSGEWSYYVRDHLGNTRVVLDENGNVKEYYNYHPYGMQIDTASEASGNNPAIYKFTGKELDDEADLDWYYFGARYYDPDLGRWLTPDPVAGKYPSLSPYVYAADNPLKFKDVDGRYYIKAFVPRDQYGIPKNYLAYKVVWETKGHNLVHFAMATFLPGGNSLVRGARGEQVTFNEAVFDLSLGYFSSKIKALLPSGIKRKLVGWLEKGYSGWSARELLENFDDPEVIKEFNRKHKDTKFVDLVDLYKEIREAERRVQERREEQRKREEEEKKREEDSKKK